MARYGSRLRLQEDGSILATGPTPSRDTYDLVYAPGKSKIEALRIEVLPDPSLPDGASGRADDGRFILSKLTSHLTSVSDSSDPPLIAYATAQADINQERDRDGAIGKGHRPALAGLNRHREGPLCTRWQTGRG